MSIRGNARVNCCAERFTVFSQYFIGFGSHAVKRINMVTCNQQVGALCFRKGDKNGLEILLVTSRDTGRWVIPKGWVENGEKVSHAAAREALEEAGVSGDAATKALGKYCYEKRETESSRQLDVTVHALQVKKLLRHWQEEKERKRRWFAAEIAATKVDEPELAALIKAFAKKLTGSK